MSRIYYKEVYTDIGFCYVQDKGKQSTGRVHATIASCNQCKDFRASSWNKEQWKEIISLHFLRGASGRNFPREVIERRLFLFFCKSGLSRCVFHLNQKETGPDDDQSDEGTSA